MSGRDRIIAEVERYWLAIGLAPDTVAEMRDEL